MQTHNVSKIRTSVNTFSRKYTCVNVVGECIGHGTTTHNSVKLNDILKAGIKNKIPH